MPGRKRPVEAEDIVLFQTPSHLRYSPEGTYLAFEVTRADREKNTYHTDIYIAKDRKAKRVTWSIDANIVLWDDDDTLIIRRKTPDKEDGLTELFRLSMHGGEAEPWISLPFALGKMEKLGDGYVAAGTISRDDPDAYLDPEEVRKDKKEKEKKEADYHVADEVPYWFNGAGFVNGKRTALFSVRTAGGEPVVERLTAPAFETDSFCVGEGKVYYAGAEKKAKPEYFNRIYSWDPEKKTHEAVCLEEGLSFGGLFMLDGALYAMASDMKAYGLNQTPDVCRIEEGRAVKVFVPPVTFGSSVLGDTAEGSGGNYAGEGEYLTLATVDDHNAVFSLAPGEDGMLACRTLWEKPGMACTMTACRERIAMVYQGWKEAAEVYESDRAGGEMTRITSLNTDVLKDRYVAEPKRIDYTSCGYDLHGWVLLPKGFTAKRKYPAVLDIHGGPRCVYGETFFHEMQLWVSKGYVVFFTNIKGSDGRGDAFADIRNDYGGTDFQNLMDFTDAVLKAYPNIDGKRVCETGGSYGGFMTNWIIGHTDRFCCAASQRSISNWVSMSFLSDIHFFGPDQCGAEGFFGDRNTELLWAHSPLKYAGEVRTPTLFIHSEEDYRCPLAEGMQMMQALVQNGVETRMVVFKGENHELSRSGKPEHRIRRLNEITGWFEKYAKR